MINECKFRITSGRSRNTRKILKPLDRNFGHDNMEAPTNMHIIKLKPDRIVAGIQYCNFTNLIM